MKNTIAFSLKMTAEDTKPFEVSKVMETLTRLAIIIDIDKKKPNGRLIWTLEWISDEEAFVGSVCLTEERWLAAGNQLETSEVAAMVVVSTSDRIAIFADGGVSCGDNHKAKMGLESAAKHIISDLRS